tara:strand:- start:862 stop:1194 length:333 start_codon:yes stop_codon:yes gene_type:complete
MGKIDLITLPQEEIDDIVGRVQLAKEVSHVGISFDADDVIDWSTKYLSGITVDEIAKEYNVSGSRIYNGKKHCIMARFGSKLHKMNRQQRLCKKPLYQYDEMLEIDWRGR